MLCCRTIGHNLLCKCNFKPIHYEASLFDLRIIFILRIHKKSVTDGYSYSMYVLGIASFEFHPIPISTNDYARLLWLTWTYRTGMIPRDADIEDDFWQPRHRMVIPQRWDVGDMCWWDYDMCGSWVPDALALLNWVMLSLSSIGRLPIVRC